MAQAAITTKGSRSDEPLSIGWLPHRIAVTNVDLASYALAYGSGKAVESPSDHIAAYSEELA